MKQKNILKTLFILFFLIIFIILFYFQYSTKTANIRISNEASKTTSSINPSLFGTWKIQKLLGFTPIQNEKSNYPTGQNVIGDNILLTEEVFSSMDIKKYPEYQIEIKAPLYLIGYNYQNDPNLFFPNNSSTDARKLLNISSTDSVNLLEITDTKKTNIFSPFGLFVINNNRIILLLDSSIYELKKVK
jgi:hypothetical protein